MTTKKTGSDVRDDANEFYSLPATLDEYEVQEVNVLQIGKLLLQETDAQGAERAYPTRAV